MARASFIGQYLGGHPFREKRGTFHGELTDDGFQLTGGGFLKTERFLFPWDDILAISVEGPDTVKERVTLTGLAVYGLLAFGMKAKEKLAYVVVTTREGDLIF